MRPNPLRARLAAGKIAVGVSQSHMPSGEIPRMCAAAGLDWIFIDSEHGPFTQETLRELIQATLQTAVAPVVRVPDFQYDLVARALDSGAEGVIFPRTESVEQLERAVSWTKFPPVGIRGFGLGAPAVGYDPAGFTEIIEHYNRETLVIAQIESQRGLDIVDELAAVEGLDSLLVGPADMSISLGVPGQWDSPKLLAGIDRVVAACEKAGKWPAIQVRNPEFAAVCMDRGMKLIGCSNEWALLWGAVSSTAAALKAHRDR